MTDNKRDFVCFLAVSVFIPGVISSPSVAADGRIEVRVVDEQGRQMAARAWVDASGQRLFNPLTPEEVTPYARDRSFSCDGAFTIAVPAGPAVVHVEKGKEYFPVDDNVVIVDGETITKTIQVRRWVDMAADGWYSADLHVHLGHDDPRVLKQLALADDVNLIPSFTYWLRGRGETWLANWPEATFNDPIMVDDRHLVTRNNIEIERINSKAAFGAAIGATFLFNLSRPLTASRYGEHFPTDAALCRVARQHSPRAVFDSDKPSWAESVVGAALGMLDTMQVCHNHYHRLRTLPGGWGMIGPLEEGESNAAAGDHLFHRTNSLYYRFLNCGFKLGVSGGSAIGVMAVPTGYNRVYAQIEGPLTADKMWNSIRAGRSFATSGPMLTLTAGGESIGGSIEIKSSQPQAVLIHTTVQSIDKLESIQIVHNGQVVASRDLSVESTDAVVKAELKFTVTPNRSGWIASRALYRAPDGLLRQAHTSPIYLSVDDKPAASADDARYMLRWLQQLASIAKQQPDRFPDTEAQQSVLSVYAEAHTRYTQIMHAAQQHWGD
jgi:hypothetical protein